MRIVDVGPFNIQWGLKWKQKSTKWGSMWCPQRYDAHYFGHPVKGIFFVDACWLPFGSLLVPFLFPLAPFCFTFGILFNVFPCFQHRPLNRPLQNMAPTHRLNQCNKAAKTTICHDLQEIVRNRIRVYTTPHRNHRHLNTRPARHKGRW